MDELVESVEPNGVGGEGGEAATRENQAAVLPIEHRNTGERGAVGETGSGDAVGKAGGIGLHEGRVGRTGLDPEDLAANGMIGDLKPADRATGVAIEGEIEGPAAFGGDSGGLDESGTIGERARDGDFAG